MANKMGLAVLLTALTTFFGFLSISANEIVLLKQFSAVSSFALLVNPLITVTFIPVYLRYLGERKVGHSHSVETPKSALLSRIADGLIRLTNRHSTGVMIGLGAVTLLSLAGVVRLKVDNDVMSFFKEDSEIRVRSRQLHEALSGTQNFFLVVDAGHEGAFRKAENLKVVSRIQQYIQKTGRFDASLSLADQVALIHREMSGGTPEKYAVPDRDDLISQYMLFFTRSDLERYVSSDFSRVNIHVRHNITSSYELNRALDDLRSSIGGIVGRKLAYHITGKSILYNQAADTMATGQAYSMILTAVPIFLMMSILFVRLKAGLLTLIPNLLPVFVLFGIMGFLDIPLHPGTAIIAAGAIGISVDDTVHLFVRYHGEMKHYNDERKALEETIRSDLRPVLVSAFALALGFLTLSFSSLVPTIHYGVLSAAVMLIGLVSDMLMTPVLLSRTKLITVWDLLGLNLTQNVIKQSELFRDMTPFQIKKIVLLGHVKGVAANDYIVRQGERERTMYFILEGAARVELETEKGGRVALKDLAEGEVFGEIALVGEVARTAHVVATRPTKVLSVDWVSLERIRRIFPRVSTRLFLNIARILGTRLSFTNTQLAEARRQTS
jgi:predicted RND superfamily exporter protein